MNTILNEANCKGCLTDTSVPIGLRIATNAPVWRTVGLGLYIVRWAQAVTFLFLIFTFHLGYCYLIYHSLSDIQN